MILVQLGTTVPLNTGAKVAVVMLMGAHDGQAMHLGALEWHAVWESALSSGLVDWVGTSAHSSAPNLMDGCMVQNLMVLWKEGPQEHLGDGRQGWRCAAGRAVRRVIAPIGCTAGADHHAHFPLPWLGHADAALGQRAPRSAP